MALPAPSGGSITTAADQSSLTGYSSDTALTPAIQTIWSKEILFQAMPVLRFEQFAVKKTELGVMPGLTVNFMRYTNLTVDQSTGATLTEGTRMEPTALSASQIQITVSERGQAISVTELLLNASFDDVMASSSRLLGRHMAQSMDIEARNTLYKAGVPFGGGSATAPSVTFGRTKQSGARTTVSPYDGGTIGTVDGPGYLSPTTIKDAVETLAGENIPRIGDTYVCFVHPSQSRSLRDWPEFIEVTKYAAPGNFMLGEIGRLYDVVFIETTQVTQGLTTPLEAITALDANSSVSGVQPKDTAYNAIMIGDNAFGQAIALPVELRDGGVIDFGREHGLAWYAIWGFGVITSESRVVINTLGGAIA
ncbi:MAG: N4-gp56 family major capsid protein [Chloroflexi bacterium]|nr:N4-gp56 family major capsid protein [Chloroflexota bacterium]